MSNLESKELLNVIVDQLLVDLISAAGRVNYCADEKDFGRNRCSYGIASHSADVLRRLGQKAIIHDREDEGFIRITKLTTEKQDVIF